eukprot:gene12715-12810_t
MKKILALSAGIVLTLCALTSAQARDRNVDIVNKTGMVLKHFYASNTGTSKWEEDILGKDVLDDGETVTVDINDGTGACKFDFKAVFDDGTSLEKDGINVCEITTYTYTK